MNLAVDKYSSTIEILDSKILSDNVVEHLFHINVKPDLADELIEAIRKDKDMIELEAMKSGNGHVYGSATLARCTVCKEVAKSKCFLASVSINSKGAQWTVLGNNDSFRELARKLERANIDVEVKLRKNLVDRDLLLTARQEQIISIAFERGYFDFPKKIGLKELATQIGIETSTLAEILRRGQKKILGEYLIRRSLLHQSQRSG
jgi:predicted DNA binding protein